MRGFNQLSGSLHVLGGSPDQPSWRSVFQPCRQGEVPVTAARCEPSGCWSTTISRPVLALELDEDVDADLVVVDGEDMKAVHPEQLVGTVIVHPGAS